MAHSWRRSARRRQKSELLEATTGLVYRAFSPPRRNAVQFVLKFFELEVKENHFETRKTWPGGKYKHYIRNPEVPLVWGGSKYYWDEHYQRNTSQKRLCFYDLVNSWSKHMNSVSTKVEQNFKSFSRSATKTASLQST